MDSFHVTLASTLLEIDPLYHNLASKTSPLKRKRQHDDQTVQVDTPRMRSGSKIVDELLFAGSKYEKSHTDEGTYECFWRGGRVIGIGKVNCGANDVGQADLVVNIIVNQLLDIYQTQRQRSESPGHRQTRSRQAENINPDPQHRVFDQPSSNEDIVPSIYLVSPPNTPTISIIYHSLLSRIEQSHTDLSTFKPPASKTKSRPKTPHPPTKTPEEITTNLLSHISVLQYLDLTGLAESIAEISDLLSRPSKSTSPSTTATSANHDQAQKSIYSPVTILIQGLHSTLLDRSSINNAYAYAYSSLNPTSSTRLSQTAALLVRILRSIRILTTQSHSIDISPDDTRSTGVRNVTTILDLDIGLERSSTSAQGSTRRDGRRDEMSGEMINTAFSDVKGRVLRIFPLRGARRSGYGHTPRSNVARDDGGAGSAVDGRTILARIVERAVDGIVVVHDGLNSGGDGDGDDDDYERNDEEGMMVDDEGGQPLEERSGVVSGRKIVVEIVKDGMGDGTGRWCVWR